ncbi:hypothetical protein ABVT39_014922, partial [Epinephelus coioides]
GISPDFILSSCTSNTAPDRYVIAALSGTYLPFRFQPGSLTFFPPRVWSAEVFAKLEISGGDITGVLIKLQPHSLKRLSLVSPGRRFAAGGRKSEVAVLAPALPGKERVNTALKIL